MQAVDASHVGQCLGMFLLRCLAVAGSDQNSLGGGGTGGDAPYDPNISGGGYTGAVDCRGANPADMYDYDCYGVDCSAPVGSLDYDAQKCGGSGRVPGLAYPKPKP